MTNKQKSPVWTTEDDLKKIVLDKLHRLGFKWVVAVDLKHHPRRNPNWEILRWSGQPPKGFNPDNETSQDRGAQEEICI
jgi:hypothetical protein